MNGRLITLNFSFLDAAYLCKTKLCSLLEQKQRLEELLENQGSGNQGMLYLGQLGDVDQLQTSLHTQKRAPGRYEYKDFF